MAKSDDLAARLASLSPEQRRLLERRMRSQGLDRALASTSSTPSSRGAVHADPGVHHCRGMQFSLFFFSADGSTDSGAKYELLLDAARFADRNGFAAVWTPERHYVEFGGLYPNPSVLGAALAVLTERVQIRAGSVVVPLHHVIRIAEEWAVVDNLSGGRAAVSCATGWHPDDFVLAPGGFDDRRERTFQAIETLRRLWAGAEVSFPGPGGREVPVRVFPRPLQRELPLWLTSAGNLETWIRAGELGTNVLASIGTMSLAELADRVRRYREARARSGHDPAAGTVSLMLHTHVGDDDAEIRRRVRAPLTEYLLTHMKQRDRFVPLDGITAADQQELTEMAFEHYFENASLLGTPAKCSRLIEGLEQAGVDEVACLVDFGLDAAHVRAGLERLDEVRRAHRPAEPAPAVTR